MTTPLAAGLLLALSGVEACAAAVALTWLRRGDRSLALFMAAPAGLAFAAALGALLVTGLLALVLAWRLMRSRAGSLAVPLAVNLLSVALVAGLAEVAVRLGTVSTIQGPVFARTVLLPYQWEDVAARGRALLADVEAGRTYLVPDAELGWTIGASRRSTDYNRTGVEELLVQRGAPPPRRSAAADAAIYVSSVEGLRSPRPDLSFASVPARRRIAVVGDSFTFGLEVTYDEAWPAQLERLLGDGVQVLNFGVDGYGVDQAYLRYRRDVEAWKPEIVVLGMIDDDVRRTMCVYAFLCFPGFGMPFGKPRLVADARGLTPLNVPLPPPATLFAKRAITELPGLLFDGAYDPVEWEPHVYHHSYAIRFALSRYRPWSSRRPVVSDDTERVLNGEIARAFIRLARERGARPIVVYFPSRRWPSSGTATPAREALTAAHINFLDMTPCADTVPADARFVALHYSPATNAAIARCLHAALTSAFESHD
ncbi:MAG TPA: hypothetical protein VHT71_14820 [Methylomirabilota bacterium]|jgi:hypothetical protein|nr:hypothetical protein [Methylomirabilota bacterium]